MLAFTALMITREGVALAQGAEARTDPTVASLLSGRSTAGHAHVVRGRGRAQRELSLEDVHHQPQSTSEGESGILVRVHPAEIPGRVDWVAPSSRADSVRMNRNNLLGHYD